MRPTIFHQLLRPDAAEGYVVPTVGELKDKAYTLVAAAADTTGNAMTIATYNVTLNLEIYQTLITELKEMFPDPVSEIDFVRVEKLPYLVGNFTHTICMLVADSVTDSCYQRRPPVCPSQANVTLASCHSQ
jgi:hypothetical protein